MSALEYSDKWKLEKLFGVASGYVLNHVNRTFTSLI